MDVLTTSDEVKEMSRRLDGILEILRIQNTLLCQILPKSAEMSWDLKKLASLESKLEDMNKSLSAIKDFVRFK
jgi:hypothetical protein